MNNCLMNNHFMNNRLPNNLKYTFMNMRKKTVVLVAALGLGFTAFLTPSCSKSHTAKMTLYDSLGGTASVADPANAGATIEKGRLGLRSVVDSAIYVIATDSRINGYFTV